MTFTADLTGRVVAITGASSGIGEATALACADAGAAVALGARRTDRIEALAARITEGGGRAVAIATDVADEASARAFVSGARDALGGLDVLVNNAAIQSETPGSDFDAVTFARILSVNLSAAAGLSSDFVRAAIAAGRRGSIINTSSVHERIPKPGYLAYAISKSGLGALTRTMALEFADRGIRVNAVGPGAVATPLNDSWINNPDRRKAVEAHIPMGRVAEAEEIAPVFTFLASDDASYITGQTIYACGGLTLYGDFQRNWSS